MNECFLFRKTCQYKKEFNTYVKIKKCINSCSNILQLETCNNLINNYFKIYKDEKIKNFLLEDLYNKRNDFKNYSK